MSVYKPKNSPYYQYDFQLRGRRFCGTTERTSRREAEQVERDVREAKKAESKIKDTFRFDAVVTRYWNEVASHTSNAKTTKSDLARLLAHFGGAKEFSAIRDSDVADVVAWRRGHHVIRDKDKKLEDCPLISNATVNRSTTELLRRLFRRAKENWGAKFDNEPKWGKHLLAETQERVRELQADEGAALDLAVRPDYAPFFDFARASGLRLRECLLKWSEVNWETRQIVKQGKGKKRVTVPITDTVRRILWPLRAHHADYVFTYTPKRIRKGDTPKRMPLTYSGVKTQWKRMRKRAGVVGFRFHDFRHDFGTKLLRQTGNLKLVQKALNHADLSSTARYAHVLDSEVADAMEAVASKQRRRA